LTRAGEAVVQEMEHLGMWIDLAHLSDAGVADIFRLTDGPVMASHANARKVHVHPRNLTDEAIKEIISRRGWIGLTFEGAFVSEPAEASIADVLRHLDHILELGGEHSVGLGSDFDGTSNTVPGLMNAGDYPDFAKQLVERYGEITARKILFDNFEHFLYRALPD
jgi:membrane dipeptidase